MKRFRGLSPAQQFAFEQIATGNDGGHHPATLAALVRKGLIVELRQSFADGLGYILRYDVASIAIHMEWCAWCAEQPEDEEGIDYPDNGFAEAWRDLAQRINDAEEEVTK